MKGAFWKSYFRGGGAKTQVISLLNWNSQNIEMDGTGIEFCSAVVVRFIGAELLDDATLDTDIQSVQNNWNWHWNAVLSYTYCKTW